MELKSRDALEIWRQALIGSLRKDEPDLSVRQMAVLLSIHLSEKPVTVRGLAADLMISKPAVTRAVDRLEQLGFARRQPDASDKRSILIERSVRGSVFLTDFGLSVASAINNRLRD